MNKLAILFDGSLCTACRGCQVACKQWNDRKGLQSKPVNLGTYENPPDLTPDTWMRMRFAELDRGEDVHWVFWPQACMHCRDAACVEVCPTKALQHHPKYDFVMIDYGRCNGCGYCTQFCPYIIPRLDGSVLTGAGKTFKCTFCQDRVTNGLPPACVKTCPTGAMRFGPADQMAAYAEQRVAKLHDQGMAEANVYGANLLGGLGRLMVLTAPPEELGLPADPKSPALAFAWQEVVQPGLVASFGLSSLAAAVAWVIARRRIRMEEIE